MVAFVEDKLWIDILQAGRFIWNKQVIFKDSGEEVVDRKSVV